MPKLQRMVDTAFGRSTTERAPQQLSEAALERDRVFAEKAKRRDALRHARVANPELRREPPVVFEVVRYRGSWRTLHQNKHSAPFADQAAAIAAAKELGRSKLALARSVKVLLRRADGDTVLLELDDEPASEWPP